MKKLPSQKISFTKAKNRRNWVRLCGKTNASQVVKTLEEYVSKGRKTVGLGVGFVRKTYASQVVKTLGEYVSKGRKTENLDKVYVGYVKKQS